MPTIQIFVEDELNEAYEILALKALDVVSSNERRGISYSVRVAWIRINELTDFHNLLDLTERSLRSGAHQIAFVIDHEGPGADSSRVRNRNEFKAAFEQLCNHLDSLPSQDSLRQVKVVRIEVHSCLEAWLLSHPRAIVMAIGGGSSYRPNVRRTEMLTPKEARDGIAHIVREVGRREGKRHLRRMGGHAIKSLGKKIAQHLDLTEARRNNASLDYFCDMISNDKDGCVNPFPSIR